GSALRLGRGAELLELLGAKADEHPEDEHVVASLARAMCQVGRHDDALAVVDRCIDRLRRRGIEPTPPLRRLAVAIASRDIVGREAAGRHQPTIDRGRTSGSSDALIGRHVERAGIANWFAGATAPRSIGRALVISGEPGIGKTAVMDTWLHEVSDQIVGVRTRCSPEQILPFEAFAPLLPTRTRPGSIDDLHTRDQLFDAVASRLRDMSDGRALVLAIDDAHWMTASSVSLLEHLLAADHLEHLRVVLTLRHHEASVNEPLRHLLDQWQAAHCVETLLLGPLSDPEIGQLAARHQRHDGTGSKGLLDSGGLRALTGGNPLFVIQVAQAGAGGTDVPSTIEHLLGRYLDGLSAGVRRGVETAALLGTNGSLSRLARCTGRDELTEIGALDAVGEGRLMFVTPINGTYRFVHELARQTVLAQVPPGRAMRLHLAIAEGLETDQQPDPFAIAHHLRLAVPAAAPQRAATALLVAARRARELGDFETSRAVAQQALDLTGDVALQADALVLMASSAQSLGEREAAARHIGAAVDLALESNAISVLARALFVKAAVMCSWGTDELAARIEDSVVGLLRDRSSQPAAGLTAGHDDVELVELVWAVCLEHPGHALRARQALAERALRIALASHNDVAIIQALHANQLVGQMILTDPQVVLAWGAEALGVAFLTDQPMMAIQIRWQIMVALLRDGRIAEARAVHAQLSASEAGVTDLAFRWSVRVTDASLALIADDLVAAERLVLEARGIGEPLAGTRPAVEYINHMGVLQLARGSLPGLHHVFGAWFDQSPGPVWHWAVAPGELLDPAQPEAIERRETLATNAGSPVPPHSEWLAELTIASEYAFRSGDHELGKLLVRCIEPFAHQHAVFGAGLSLGSMWRPYALALAAAGDDRDAREAMATARLVNAGAGLPLWARLSRLVD
ncbi:MAG: transcriptional regulator, partial [Ilumatobacteraceae bacterium]|nr:transcriptional regulator [Ilumatobacteraceae bacterium]